MNQITKIPQNSEAKAVPVFSEGCQLQVYKSTELTNFLGLLALTLIICSCICIIHSDTIFSLIKNSFPSLSSSFNFFLLFFSSLSFIKTMDRRRRKLPKIAAPSQSEGNFPNLKWVLFLPFLSFLLLSSSTHW